MDVKLSHQEFLLMQRFIREQCGILVTVEKSYLIESRLAKILSEYGARSFVNFYQMLNNNPNKKEITRKVIDAITTNETRWFRDQTPWNILEDILLPAYTKEIREGNRSRVRIWSSACATGQEPYSTAMCIDRYLNRQGLKDIDLSRFEILASDISQTALQVAASGKYDDISMSRGLSDYYKEKYFNQRGRSWVLTENIKKAVQFRQFNLRETFLPFHKFDIVFCRYVTIYFSEEFKREVFQKLVPVLSPGGFLFLGNSEILPEGMKEYETLKHKEGIYYRVGRSRNYAG